MHKKMRCNIIIVICFIGVTFSNIVSSDDWIYTTSKGDTLWDFSQKYLHHATYWTRIKKLNGIENPKRLQPNRSIRVPISWVKVNPVSARLITLFGQAHIIKQGSKEKLPAQVNSQLDLGDKLVTSAASNVTIQFADKSLITLHENSEALFDHLSAYGDSGMVDSRIHLQQGRAESRVERAVGPGSRFEIHTPSAISAVRGTEYRLTSDAEGQTTKMEVLEGQVAIGSENQTLLIEHGYGSKVEKGKVPIAAHKLLAAPEWETFPDPIRQLNYLLAWQPLEGAKQYRVELSPRDDFNQVSWSRVMAHPRVNLPDLAEGQHFVRIRGIDELELEGLNAQFPVMIDVRPQAPILLKPAQQKTMRAKGPELEWSVSFDAHRYRLQISADADFYQLLEEHVELSEHRFDLSHLSVSPQEEGKSYYWRVASVAEDGELGPYSPSRQFEVKPIPQQPSTQMVSDDDQISLSWQAGREEQSYEIQLAEDSEFQQLLAHETLQQPEWVIPQEDLSVRYFRVRILEQDGFKGAWSTIQKIDPPPDEGWLYFFVPATLLIFLL